MNDRNAALKVSEYNFVVFLNVFTLLSVLSGEKIVIPQCFLHSHGRDEGVGG